MSYTAVETINDYLCQELVKEWRINSLSCVDGTPVEIPIFCSISKMEVKFCLMVLYQKITLPMKYNDYSTFKVVFNKSFDFKMQPSVNLEIQLQVNYEDGTPFKEYNCLSRISVNEMKSLTCIDDISRFYETTETPSKHYIAISHDKLILKLRMKFSGHLISPSVYHTEMCALKNLKKFAKDFSALLESSALSDITIQVAGKDLSAHRAILAAHSPVFMKMMESDFLESNTNSITIYDFTYDIFGCFLKYLYSGEVEDKSWLNVTELYVLADKYDVQALKKECINIIASFLTVENVCKILIFAYEKDETDLKEEAKYFAAKYFDEIVCTSEWQELVTSHLIIGYDVMTLACSVQKITKRQPCLINCLHNI